MKQRIPVGLLLTLAFVATGCVRNTKQVTVSIPLSKSANTPQAQPEAEKTSLRKERAKFFLSDPREPAKPSWFPDLCETPWPLSKGVKSVELKGICFYQFDKLGRLVEMKRADSKKISLKYPNDSMIPVRLISEGLITNIVYDPFSNIDNELTQTPNLEFRGIWHEHWRMDAPNLLVERLKNVDGKIIEEHFFDPGTGQMIGYKNDKIKKFINVKNGREPDIVEVLEAPIDSDDSWSETVRLTFKNQLAIKIGRKIYSYKFDDRGNWIARSDGKTRAVRKIEYY
jgi:hypothetical protein